MKLKHWVLLGFAAVGVIAVWHYYQHQGFSFGGSANVGGVGANLGGGISG